MIAKIQRSLNTARKRNSKLRHKVPHSIGAILINSAFSRNKIRNVFVGVKHRSDYINIYHCCTQKTGSVWIGNVLNDPVVYKYSGLTLYNYKGKRRSKQTDPVTHIKEPFPQRSIVSAMKISYENYKHDIPKAEGPSKCFFVIRDPRELVVSWYFSAKKNHVLGKGSPLMIIRQELNELSLQEGLKKSIDFFVEKDKFGQLRSWNEASNDQEEFMILKYEDLSGENSVFYFQQLFDFIDIRVPKEDLNLLISDYSFKKLVGERKETKEKTDSHLRSGGSTWRKYFDDEIKEYFVAKAGPIVEELGYEW